VGPQLRRGLGCAGPAARRTPAAQRRVEAGARRDGTFVAYLFRPQVALDDRELRPVEGGKDWSQGYGKSAVVGLEYDGRSFPAGRRCG